MKQLLFILLFLDISYMASAQYVYTINADSTKITGCDSNELIVENHTQGVPGFLFNTGNGRTVFKRGVIRVNDSLAIIGADSLRLAPAWLLNGNPGVKSTQFLGTTNTQNLVLKTNNIERGRLIGGSGNLLLGSAFDFGDKLQVTGTTSTTALKLTVPDPATGPGILFNDGTFGVSEIGRINIDKNTGGVSFGRMAGNGSTTSDYVAIGDAALSSGYSGSDAVAVGGGALGSSTSGGFNTAIGGGALGELVSGGYDIGIGTSACAAATTAYNNIGIGPFSLFFNNNTYNVGIGTQAGYENTSGTHNILIGSFAGLFNQTGSNNIFIGHQAGNNGTSGSGNIFIGYQAGGTETGSNLLYIHNNLSNSPLVYGDFSALLFRLNANTFQNAGSAFFGGLGAPTARVHIAAGAAAAGRAPIKLTAGTVLTTPEDGAVEYDGANYSGTVGAVRYTLAKTLTTTATLDFSNTGAQSSSDLTVALSGVSVGDAVAIGPDNASISANTSYTAWVSAANTVTVRFNNYSTGAVDPASGAFRVSVIKY